MIAVCRPCTALSQEKIATNAALVAVLLLGLILRLGVTIEFPNINHPDEIYQTIEQARRLTTGVGIIPWEFERGIRSWALPGFFAGLMDLSRLWGRTPDNYLAVIYTFMDFVSLIPVTCGFLWGLRVFGLSGAILVGFVTATWAELIYFAPHTLTEVAAGSVLASALYIAYPDRREVGAGRLFAAGVLFGITFVLRFHLAPAIAVAVACVCELQVRRRWIPVLVGASIPVLAGGLLDAVTWQYPFQSIWLNIWVNLYEGISNRFAVLPWFYILGFLGYFWGGAFAFIVCLALLGGRRLPLLLGVAATILLMHSLIGHKDYRFVYPAVPLIATLAGIGTVEVLHALWDWVRPGFSRGYGVLMAMGLWSCVSVSLLASAPFQYLLLHFSGELAAFRTLSQDSGVCGIALYGVDVYKTPGYTYLRQGIKLYELNSADQMLAEENKFNAIIGENSAAVPGQSFSLSGCFDNGYQIRTNQLGATRTFRRLDPAEPICIWRRRGNCAW
jgi:phosphatidylinositol glycan class B